MRKKDWFEDADLPREPPPADPAANARRVAFYLHDPLPPLVQMDCPLLAVFGAEDRSVDTAESVAILERLKRERRKDITIMVYPRVGHALITWRGAPTFYAPGYLDLIADWPQRQLDRLRRHRSRPAPEGDTSPSIVELRRQGPELCLPACPTSTASLSSL
jgi:pimeloyl-ACP methyl ester carboxylesterase